MKAIRRTRLPGKIDPNVIGGAVPLSVDGCILWLDATKITGLNDNDDLTTWEDLSDEGIDVTESTNKPKYRTSGISSLPSVQFGIATATKLTSSESPTVTNFSLFIVWRATSYAVSTPIIFQQNAINTGIVTYHASSGNISWRNPNGNDIIDGGHGIDKTYVYLFKHGSEIEAWLDGSLISASGSAAIERTKTITVGNWETSGYQLTGYIGEVIWYDRVLTSPETTTINNYLIGKWQ